MVAVLTATSLSLPTESYADYRHIGESNFSSVEPVRAERILCIRKDRQGWKVGTATILNDKTVLTAYHVVEGCSIVYIGKKTFKVTHSDPSIDLAVLGSGLDFRQLNCQKIPKGRHVSLTGYPEGSKQKVVSQGVTVRDRKSKYSAVEGFAMKGMSGGPVIQDNERLAGIFKSFRGTSRYWYVPGVKICKSLKGLKGARLDDGSYVPPRSDAERFLVAENKVIVAPQQNVKAALLPAPIESPAQGAVPASVVSGHLDSPDLEVGPQIFARDRDAVRPKVPAMKQLADKKPPRVLREDTLPTVAVKLTAQQHGQNVPKARSTQNPTVDHRGSPRVREKSVQVAQNFVPKNPTPKVALNTYRPSLDAAYPHQKTVRKMTKYKPAQGNKTLQGRLQGEVSGQAIGSLAEGDLAKDSLAKTVNTFENMSLGENNTRLVGMTVFGPAQGAKTASLGENIYAIVPKVELTAKQILLANMHMDIPAKTSPVVMAVQPESYRVRAHLWSYWGQLALSLFLGFTVGGCFMLWGGRLNRMLATRKDLQQLG